MNSTTLHRQTNLISFYIRFSLRWQNCSPTRTSLFSLRIRPPRQRSDLSLDVGHGGAGGGSRLGLFLWRIGSEFFLMGNWFCVKTNKFIVSTPKKKKLFIVVDSRHKEQGWVCVKTTFVVIFGHKSNGKPIDCRMVVYPTTMKFDPNVC